MRIQNSDTSMRTFSDYAVPENMSLTEGFSYYVIDNALNYPYFMGYLLLATLIIVGVFKPAWLEKLGGWGLMALGCLALLALALLVLYVVFGMMVLALQGLGLPLIAVWNIAFMLTIGIAIVVVLVILRKCECLPE